MHLTRKVIERWVGKVPPGAYLIRLDDGDSMPRGTLPGHMPPYDQTGLIITGPAIAELVVYSDGGWSAREAQYETPESIAPAPQGEEPTCYCGRLGHRLGGPILHKRTEECPR